MNETLQLPLMPTAILGISNVTVQNVEITEDNEFVITQLIASFSNARNAASQAIKGVYRRVQSISLVAAKTNNFFLKAPIKGCLALLI